MKKTFYLTKDFLVSHYIIKKLSAPKIAKIVGCTFTTIYDYLKKFKIKTRKRILKRIHCIICGKLLGKSAHFMNSKYCMKCMGKSRLGEKHHGWKGGLPKCLDCGKQLTNYHAKRCLECIKDYLSKTYRGINHAGWKGGPGNCIDCGKKLTRRGHKRCKKCFGLSERGKNSPSYIHGQGRKNYSIEFRPSLKQQIRERDNFICQCCGLEEKYNKRGNKQINLTVHHINYDRFCCEEDNLITVCQVCNSKVNFNRDYWYAYCVYLMENR